MNRVIHRDLKAADLPPELRGGIDPSHRVRVVVEDVEDRSAARSASAARILSLAGAASNVDTSIDDAVARVRTIRDEWD